MQSSGTRSIGNKEAVFDMAEAALARLQDELQELKKTFRSQMQLRKTKGAGGPFPIDVSATILTPAELSAYDLSGFQVHLTIGKEVLSSYEQESGNMAGIALEVRGAEMPLVLRQKVAGTLYSRWAANVGKYSRDAGLHLAYIFEEAQRDFLSLVTSLPELMESYESVGHDGATARRYMINDPDSHLEPANHASPCLSRRDAAIPSSVLVDEQKVGQEMRFPPAVQEEIAFLQRRYRSAILLTSTSKPGADEAGAVLSFTLELHPTDPSWKCGLGLPLQGSLMTAYPEPGTLAVTISHTSHLDPDVRAIVNRIIAAQMLDSQNKLAGSGDGRGGALRNVIRRIENSAGEFVHLADDVLLERRKRQESSKANLAKESHVSKDANGSSYPPLEGLDLDSADKHTSSAEALTSGVSDSSWTADEHTDEGEESAEDADAGMRSPGRADVRLEGDVLGVHLEGLKLDNVDALEPLRLQLQVACRRCSSAWAVELATDAASIGGHNQAGACEKCSNAWSLQMRPLLVHAHSSTMAALKPEGCVPVDLLPSLCAAQCGSCSKMASFRAVQVGQVAERNCSSCHVSMGVSFCSVTFVPRRSAQVRARQKLGGSRGSSNPGRELKNAALGVALTVGHPLPAFGTCQHYPHSHRWLRFPCCGQRFACDLCHEEHTDGHEMKWAARHVCGYCSTEQAIEDRCTNCNKRLTYNSAGALGSTTRHWEGGQGCRNKKRLDRRDRAKYRGSKNKTVSRKAFRVGQEGASQREKKSKAT